MWDRALLVSVNPPIAPRSGILMLPLQTGNQLREVVGLVPIAKPLVHKTSPDSFTRAPSSTGPQPLLSSDKTIGPRAEQTPRGWEFHPLTRRNKDYKRKWRYGARLALSRNRAHAQDLGAPCQRGGEPGGERGGPDNPSHSWGKGCRAVLGQELGAPFWGNQSHPGEASQQASRMEQVNVGRRRVPEPTPPHLPQCCPPPPLLRSAAPGRTRGDRGHQEDTISQA